MKYHILKPISWILIISLLSGCSSRRIYFTSDPPGALVSAGGGTCTTPCYLNVPLHTQKAVFSMYSGAKEEVSLSHLTTRGAGARYGAERAGGFTLKSLGWPLFFTGLFALGMAESYQSDVIQTGNSSSRDETIFWIVAATGFVSGSLLLLLGDSISNDAKDVKPEVYVKLEKPQPYLLVPPVSTPLIQPAIVDDGKGRRLKLLPDMDSHGKVFWK